MFYPCRLETQDRTSPIDLATGQISGQQEIEVEGNPSYIETKKKLKSPAKKLVKDQPDNNQTRTQSFVLTAKSSEPVTSTPTSPHSAIQRERSPTYNNKELPSETDQVECDIDSQEPNYDEVTTVLEQSAHLQANKLLPLEHKYHVLCDPNKATDENKSEARNSGDHHYEKVNNVKDQYNVLKSGMEVNPLQDGVVQEDAKSPNEDKYYSTTRGHRLVPVGKRLNQSDSDHYYEALSRDDTKRYDVVQVRHNTFTSPANPRDQEKRVAVRSHSTIENNLDPMYDEPFKTDSAAISGDRSISCLFDDPKYASKGTDGRAKPPERRVSVTTGPRKESEATNITKTQ